MQPNLRRSYGAVTPVTNQGGPGGCSAPSGAAVALIQIGTLTPSGNGYLQGGAQGVASFPNALILYQPGDQYGTAVAMPLNPANGEFDVQVQFAATDLYGDLLGYFKAPGGQYFMQGGNTFGTTAKLGTLDNQPLELYVNNVRAMRYEYNASGTNVIGGISTNAVSGSHFQVTIGGGGGNTANANQATISGGGGNVALGTASTVSGGVGNNASGFESVVTGGASNAASGTYSTVGGGNSNTASGDYSYAAGFHANANGSGCFVFSDASSANPTSCFSPQVFVVRAINGFYFFTGGSSDATYTGAQLVHGSSAWSTYSDRSGKENIEAIDPREVLSKLVAMPIATWNWKSQEAGTRHMGPMAQDFRTAFGLGEDDRHITTVDSEGVALAAIQGLHQLVQEKDARIEALEGAVAELKRLVEAFEVKQER